MQINSNVIIAPSILLNKQVDNFKHDTKYKNIHTKYKNIHTTPNYITFYTTHTETNYQKAKNET